MTDTHRAIEAVRATLAKGPTPGPWQTESATHTDDLGYPETPIVAPDVCAYVAVAIDFGPANPGIREANATFIAACNPTNMRLILAERDALRAALDRLVCVIDAGVLLNLSRGVELGPTVWYVKAEDAMTEARAALAAQPKAEPVDIETVIDSFIEDYEMLGETEDGRDAIYTPNDNDRAILKDAIMGLLAEPGFIAAVRPMALAAQPDGRVS